MRDAQSWLRCESVGMKDQQMVEACKQKGPMQPHCYMLGYMPGQSVDAAAAAEYQSHFVGTREIKWT